MSFKIMIWQVKIFLMRMYQALLALGDHKSARKLLRKILIFDPHVCCVIDSSQRQPMYAGQPTLRIKILQTQTRHAETKVRKLIYVRTDVTRAGYNWSEAFKRDYKDK